ncbi:MAG: 4-alpha-glucanotransferase [Acidobacteriota bacterium]
MIKADDGIETHYVDAMGRRHETSRPAREAIRRAIGTTAKAGGSSGSAGSSSHRTAAGRKGPSPEVIVAAEHEQAEIGPANVRLEDGTTLTVDHTLPADVPAGYHQTVRRDGSSAMLIVAPARCFLSESSRTWGWAIQLYAARSKRSWGIGDLADLRRLGRWAAKNGAGIALINPLAAVTPTLPQQASPYFPSSRRFRSPLYLRIEEVEGAETLDDLSTVAARGRALNGSRLIARDEVFRLKMPALERIWDAVRGGELPALDAFVAEQGSGLREFATFCSLAEQFQTGWHGWPVEFRHPGSAGVKKAARRRQTADRIRFHQWVQLQIDRQLARASRALPVMQDLPIGFDADGADAWAFQDVLAPDISVGAPPDEFNTKGQNWGLPPFVPAKLRAAGYQPFIDTIRACVRHAGGLRIDHVMGLFRLFWIPRGMEPKEGAYVRSDAEALLAIVAIESQRARAVIVGEDLGTVEEETRTQLEARAILSYRLLWFERGSPASYPKQALAAVTTHDLPTIAGLWSGSDLEAQKIIGLSPNEKGTREILGRIRRLTRSPARTATSAVVARVLAALATAPSRILTATIEALEKSPVAARIAKALDRRRGSPLP